MSITPMLALFSFTIRRMLGDWKFWGLAAAMLLPCILALLIRRFAPPINALTPAWNLYHNMFHFMFLMGLVPMSCMIYGNGLIVAEAETRTVGYLITRRLRRRTVLLTRFVAAAVVLAALTVATAAAMHFAILGGHNWAVLAANTPTLASWNPYEDLKVYLVVAALGAIVFLAVFTLIGLLSAKPLVLSVSYLVIVEFVISNLPVAARTYSVLHQLRAMVVNANPQLVTLFQLPPDVASRVFPPGDSGYYAWSLIVGVALIVACLLVTSRELVPSKVARD